MESGDAERRGTGAIVVAGEALVDLVFAESGELVAHPGGGPFNAARAASRLGAPAHYLGCLSGDRFGAILREALAADGVGLGTAVATDDPTTLALAEIGDDGSAAYRFYVEGTSAPGLTFPDAAAVLPADVAILCVGTLGLVFEPTAATLERLVAEAGDEVLVAVDPNCRPAAIADPAAYRARLERILRRADVVKASAEDLAWLRPGAEVADAIRTLLRPDGGAVGLVTLGAEGALVVTATGAVAVAAPPARVVDTIGAGDAFLGGLLSWWHGAGLGRGDVADLPAVTEATTYACRIAALTCERPGANPPHRDELPADA
ncbi:MAG: fructokinase [Baekduia sp.]|nr:fructokinase [Baekduia sp.]